MRPSRSDSTPASMIDRGVSKSGSPIPRLMTSVIVAAMSKNFRIPDGGTSWTRCGEGSLGERDTRVGASSHADELYRAGLPGNAGGERLGTRVRTGPVAAGLRSASSIRPAISRISAASHPALGRAGRPETEAARPVRRARVERDDVAVRQDRRVLERDLGDVAGQAAAAKVDEDHVVVRPAADDAVAASRQLGCERRRVRPDPPLHRPERLAGGDLEADRLGRDPPEVRRALRAREDRPVDLAGEVRASTGSRRRAARASSCRS